ncbi:MAG: 30S ribosomal protein S15 [Candidatus Aenigmatarchaeota archaeon]
MARMHSRKHGKSGSKKPMIKIKPEWVSYDKDELVRLIEKLAKEGKTDSQIGLILRDTYGVPDVRAFDLRISKVTSVAIKKEVPDDLYFLLKKVVNLYKHLDYNKPDAKSIRARGLIESKIRRLVKYYKRTDKMPEDWTYNRKNAELIVK